MSQDINDILEINPQKSVNQNDFPSEQPQNPNTLGPQNNEYMTKTGVPETSQCNQPQPNNYMPYNAYAYQPVRKNKIAGAIKIIGWIIIIAGCLAGFIIGVTLTTGDSGYEYMTEPNPLRWVYGLFLIITSVISGVSFLGFSEIIRLLDNINRQITK